MEKKELKRFSFKIQRIQNGLLITDSTGKQHYAKDYAEMLMTMPNMVQKESDMALTGGFDEICLDVILSAEI